MSPAILHSIFLFFFLLTPILFTNAEESMVPLTDPMRQNIISFPFANSRRKLNGFQICSLCTCCNNGGAGGTKYCTPSPCCYAINCNIPNRPFGFCSFTPKTCNCFGCHL
ncbi:hypothetical protein M8C21_026952 [Ambrosia artemisiifolia]|uniref:DUF7866 domain-containing protein n=1 Tax=Ambrosia artemisiifolia TaxID=4212 RepID=A0AAD5C3Q7_AMBAR|nr:hypothetical protein M8C21_026952 [Ambrosia artemisiifolia]